VIDEVGSDGVSERGANHDVDVVDGLRAEWSAGGGAVIDQVCVEAVEVFGAKRADDDCADGWVHVVLDHP
jgi:hypothetical protein